MEINRRALYNSLRMNWVLDPTLKVEVWQVEDYRSMPIDSVFERLEDHSINLDKATFRAYAETVDTPEELVDVLIDDEILDVKVQDQVYLLVFELWRRLLPEKPCLSVFCDEIDHQINLFDRGQTETLEAVQDALANLETILDENTDEGADHVEAFDYVQEGCANDLEAFLYDFIVEQINNENDSYAHELLEGFSEYIHNITHFEFLRAQLLMTTDLEEANQIVKHLIEDDSVDPDLDFNFDVLTYLTRNGDQSTFEKLVKKSVHLLNTEEDFHILVTIAVDFYHRIDNEQTEVALQTVLSQLENRDLDKPFNRKNPQFVEFSKIIKC